MIGDKEVDLHAVKEDSIVILVWLQAKDKSAAGDIRILEGRVPLEMPAEKEIAGRIAEWEPVVPAELRPVVAEVLQIPEPAVRCRQVSLVKIGLNFRIQLCDTLGGGQVWRLCRPGSWRWPECLRSRGS